MPEISDERLKELEQAEKLNKELESEKKQLTKENEELTETKEDLEESIREKDELIEKKNEQIVGVRKKYSEMNAEEKEELTERERSLMQEQEELAKRQEQFEKDQAEKQKKEIEARKKEAFKSLVGDDEELLEKLDYHYGRIKDAEEASTAEEITGLAEDALSMLGREEPDAVQQAVNAPKRGEAGTSGDKDFSTSPQGKELGSKMGLASVKMDEDNSQNPGDQQPGGNPLDRA